MKIIPQNGMILVKYLGRGETTTAAGIVITGEMDMPKQGEVVSCKVLAVDTDFKDENGQSVNLINGQVVLVVAHSIRPMADDPTNTERGLIRYCDVLAVIEEEDEDAN